MSLLDLPPEIRALIYAYLVPEIPIIPYNLHDLKSFRQDNQHCSPALLQTNRTIYNELVRQWYTITNTIYAIGISSSSLKFAGRTFPILTPLPSILQHVSKLRLIVVLAKAPEMEESQTMTSNNRHTPGTTISEAPYVIRERIEALVESFTKSERLPTVWLVVNFRFQTVFAPLRESLEENRETLDKTLEWNLGPLKGRVRLSADRYEANMPLHALYMCRNDGMERDLGMVETAVFAWNREFGLFDECR